MQFCIILSAAGIAALKAPLPFVFKIVCADSGRAIPLVELELENGLKLISDNDGHIAVISPDLFQQNVSFKIKGHGYSTQTRDFWGNESVTCLVVPGAEKVVALKRLQLAERLYRITGAARFNHTLLAGRQPSFPPAARINSGVIGQDSLIVLPWQGKLWHFYGDTLGLTGFNFSASCATAPLPQTGLYDPEIGIPLSYLEDENGFARPMIDTGKNGFTWIEYVLPVEVGGRETLVAKYVQHQNLDRVGDAGFALFNQSRGNFTVFKRISSLRHHKCTHPVPIKYRDQNFFMLFPWEMAGEKIDAICNEARHFYYSCLEKVSDQGDSGVIIEGDSYRLRRDENGQIQYRWQQNGVGCSALVQKKLFDAGLMRPSEALFAPVLLETGERIINFNGSIVYNNFRRRWVMINQGNRAGELVYAEADTPTGPWAFARRVCEFADYNLYNPVIHPWFSRGGGKTIFFEGTYTNYFSSAAGKNPEADYNQVMFKLDLERSEMLMPIAVYSLADSQLLDAASITASGRWNEVRGIEFFAFSRDLEHPDLAEAQGKDGAFYPFKILKASPETEWGRSWMKPPQATAWKIIDFAEGRVIVAETAFFTVTHEIQPREWPELRSKNE